MKALLGLSALASTASATGILIPLYVYPSAVFNDGAANWQPVRDAIQAHPDVPWQVVINPDSGPGGTRQPGNGDTNYISGVSQFNALSTTGFPVTTVGYVHISNGNANESEVEANITTWRDWSTHTPENASVQGIFFDEAIEAPGAEAGANFDYLNRVISFARSAFSSPISVICNFGTKPADSYYSICDIVIAFESCFANNAGDGCAAVGVPEYLNQTTIDQYVPSPANRPQAAVLVHDYNGTNQEGDTANLATLASDVQTLKANNVGWLYFVTGGFDNITLPPANVTNLADLVANAEGRLKCRNAMQRD